MNDVVIVAAGRAYTEYLKYQAYVGHPNRPFRPEARWMAFYAEKAIKSEVPAILEVRHAVLFSKETISQLHDGSLETDRDVADLIGVILAETRRSEGGTHDVVLLSPPGDPQTLKLPKEVPGTKTDRGGRPIPITMGQYRYTRMEALVTGPSSTDELGL
jgi:hypothetical protein